MAAGGGGTWRDIQNIHWPVHGEPSQANSFKQHHLIISIRFELVAPRGLSTLGAPRAEMGAKILRCDWRRRGGLGCGREGGMLHPHRRLTRDDLLTNARVLANAFLAQACFGNFISASARSQPACHTKQSGSANQGHDLGNLRRRAR